MRYSKDWLSMTKAAPQAQADAQVSGSVASISGGTLFVAQSGGAATVIKIFAPESKAGRFS